MRKSSTQPLKGIIREYIAALGHQQKLKEVNLIVSWEAIAGKLVARHTQKIYVKNKVLYVYLNSAVLRNELMMMRDDFIHKINEHSGSEIIQKIVFR